LQVKIKGPAMAATMDRPDASNGQHRIANRGDFPLQGPSRSEFERRVRDLEAIAAWRDDVVTRIARETLIFEFADCTRREEFARIEAEVSLFKQVCRAIAGSAEEPLSDRKVA
jgi:hypothetical protein